MRLPFAILTTLLLIVGTELLSPVLGTNLTLILVLGTAIWAAYDSVQIQLPRYKSGISYGPLVLFIGLVMLWIVAFPWYLSVRHQITHGLAELKPSATAGTAALR